MAAETAVSFAVNTVSNLLVEEASLLVGVKDEVEWLRDRLGWMKSFLKDAYTKRRRGDERAKQWERAVREAAYRVEDIIESYTLEIISRRQQPLRCRGILKPVERYARELKSRHKLGADIKQLKVKIQQITENRTAYGLVDLGQSASDSTMDADLQERRRISPRYGDSIVVGFQEHKRKILGEILDTNLTRRCFKSIVGMGGLGKTTLAKMVFNTDEITKSFSTRAWVSVSQDYTLIQLLKNLTKQITGSESDGVDESALREKIYEFLQGKRYFIVFDDIWTTGICQLIEKILPNDSNSSRVLLTTRFMEVARFGDSSIEPYQLPCLNENEGLELFLKKAFRTTHDTIPECPRGLEEIARRLVNKCGGLPLAIVVLGGLMSNKTKTPKAWMEEEERMDWESTQEEQQCLEILALSYDDITDPNMRSCFLYMGVFPKDSLIEASQLITLWVAEGFIPQRPNRTMEDTAVNYLDQLVQRSMIEVVKRDWDGSIKKCRIHDLLRDLCLKEAREDGFLHVFRGSTDLSSMGLEHNPGRLAFHYVDKVEGCCPGPDLRSLSIYRASEKTRNASEITKEMFQGLTKLRVMYLERLSLSESESLLAETKPANHLRYLALTHCYGLSKLPQSFGYIYPNLQTLDVRKTDVRQLPESLGNMKTLRHLYMPFDCKLPPNIANLTNLQTIDTADASGGWIEQSLAVLSSIRRLSIYDSWGIQQKDFANALRELKHLSSLKIFSFSEVSAEYIRALSNNNRLFSLSLRGFIPQRQLPEIHYFLQNLTVLRLERTKLEKDPMPTLERLPNLASLRLGEHSYSGKELVCTAGGFPRLEKLKLVDLYELERWDLEDGAMPNLASLTLRWCFLLRIPKGLPNLKKLQKLDTLGLPDSEVTRRSGGRLADSEVTRILRPPTRRSGGRLVED